MCINMKLEEHFYGRNTISKVKNNWHIGNNFFKLMPKTKDKYPQYLKNDQTVHLKKSMAIKHESQRIHNQINAIKAIVCRTYQINKRNHSMLYWQGQRETGADSLLKAEFSID